MTSDYDADALLKFLDYLAEKGIGKPETMKSRRIAVSRVVETLGADELADLRQMDIDSVMERFFNLEGSRYSPDSMRAYKSRVNTAVADFLRYRENPAGFKIQGQRRSRSKKETTSPPGQQERAPSIDEKNTSERPNPDKNVGGTIDTVDVPIPLRPSHVSVVSGLPHDLKRSEAQRIANVILAMAVDEE